ncbi:MAG TPA: serine/threonine-protein kinase [Micromonosporaceae bacterium]
MTTQTSAWQGEPGTPSIQRAVPGDIVGGRYELRSTIGNGGMGTVWQAIDTVLRRDVAVKEVLLPAGMPPNERHAMYERTLREGRAAAALSHPSVVQVYDVVTEGGRPWIVMELLNARSLSEIIIADGPIAGRAVAKIGIALLGALEVAHVAGVLHRDVKPANVLICADGRCVLTDFGVARMPSESNLTQPGMVLGSPHFISPERAIGAAFGPPSDLFSLGVTLYTAVEGRPPFDKGDPFETMRAIVEDQPAPPVRAGALTPVLMGLLEKDPARRWTVPQARAALRELSGAALGTRTASPALPAQARPPVELAPASDAAPIAAASASAGAASAPTPAIGPAPVPPRQLGAGRDGEVATAPTNAGYAVPPRVASVFDAPAAASASPTSTFTDRTYEGLPPVTTGGGVGVRAWSAVRAWPRALQLGAAAGAAAIVIVLIVVFALSGGGSTTPKPAAGGVTPTKASTPSFAVKSFHDRRGITVNVPASWHKAATSNYTDFTDPSAAGRKIRVNVEHSGNDTPDQYLQVAEHGLENPKECTSPYSRVSLTDVSLDGHSGAVLEYTCGSGASERHGAWAATTINGHAYEFYLTVPDSAFAASKPIFTEMLNSFRLGAPAV